MNDLLARLDELYAIGGGIGANRPGLGTAEGEAFDLVEGWMDDAGLQTGRDPAGNLYGRLPGTEPGLPDIWSGSHLDTVPSGGRFDGALGVLTSVAALRRIGPQRRTLTAVAFRDEEGWRFGRGFFGSRAATGTLQPGMLDCADADGITVREALARLGLRASEDRGWLATPPAAFVELHIEQGPVLADRGAPLGIVESIAGLADMEVVFHGREGHAGTVPMRLRDDAGVAAARFHLAVTEAAKAIAGAVATIGRIELRPGASNVIPGEAHLTLDARAPDDARRDELIAAIERAAGPADIAVGARTPAVQADPRIRAALAAAAPGAPSLPSGAGHDAQILAGAGVPVGMLFVRSLAGGVSHSPDEQSSPEDIRLGVDALAAALSELAA